MQIKMPTENDFEEKYCCFAKWLIFQNTLLMLKSLLLQNWFGMNMMKFNYFLNYELVKFSLV